MPTNIFYIDKVDKSKTGINISLLRNQRDWFVEEEMSAQTYLDHTELVQEGINATKKQLEMIQETINLMDALLDLGEGYA